MKLKTVAMTGVMSLAGLGLVGAGAHAVFTTSTTSSQNITSGNLSVVLSSAAATAGNSTTTLTLGAYGPTASSFTTGDDTITMTNNGTIPATELTVTLGTNYPSSQLAADLYVCTVRDGYVIYNGPLADGLSPLGIPTGTIASGGTDSYTTNIYAGSEPTLCGDNFTAGPLTTLGGFLNTTSGDATSPAPSLTNVDMNQSLNVTVTVGYSG
jgi:hypothetical protein